MCGIAGFLEVRRLPGAERVRESVLENMTRGIAHRGPDAHGLRYQETLGDGTLALGHRRLAIVDLSEAGRQPMRNETGDVWIVYNGEIFNHASLRPALEAAGHRYSSHTDTETIIHSWEEYGPACLDRFRGMFAFALWDERAQTLFCARDRLGIKPFYYFWDGNTFAFGSEIKALLEHPAVPTEFEDSLLQEYLAFGYVSGDRTLYRSIRKLMPGHWMTIRNGQMKIERYWDIPEPPAQYEDRSEAEWIADCRARLEETVRMRLMSDVPLGVFLSGGVDSSAIAALTSRFNEGSGPVKTFSVGYEEAQYSELGYAAHMAKVIGSEHREVKVSMQQFFDTLPRLIWHEDEPITWPSSVSLHFVAQLAREHVTVVLTGEGSDELFGGYARYRQYLMNERLLPYYRAVPGGLRNLLRHTIAESNLIPGGPRRKLQHTMLGRGDSLESIFLDNFYGAFSGDEVGSLLRKPGKGNLYQSYFEHWNRAERPTLPRMLYADQKTYLVELLMKQDQMSMANSLESRVPFLDHTFVEFSTRVPDSMKIRGKEQKYILKRAVEGIIPNDIIYRTKMGFPTPLRDWFRQPTAAPLLDMLLNSKGLVGEYLRPEPVAMMVSRHRAGLEDATDRLWRLVNLELWGNIFFNGRREIPEGFFSQALAHK